MTGPDMHANPGVCTPHPHPTTNTCTRVRGCMHAFALASAPPWTPGFEALREVVSSLSAAGSHNPAHWALQELMELVHLHLVKEYIVRLSKRRLVLKTAEQQQQLAGHILANANLIQLFCTQNVSPGQPCPSAPLQTPSVLTCTSLAPGAFLEKGQPPSNQACLAGLPSDLAASSPPQARRDHSPARPQCHQDRGGHLCHLLP